LIRRRINAFLSAFIPLAVSILNSLGRHIWVKTGKSGEKIKEYYEITASFNSV